MIFKAIRSGAIRQSIRRYAKPSGLEEVVILGAARTPIGSLLGALTPLSATDLGAHAIKSAVQRSKVDPAAVQECYMGLVVAADTGSAPAKQAALRGGLTVNTPATAINKLCASGMKTIMVGASSIMLGQQDVICAGGMESMTNAPFLMKRQFPPYGGFQMSDALLRDALTDSKYNIHMGQCAESVALNLKITRQMQDEYATRSYKLSLESSKNGILAKEIEPVRIVSKKAKDGFIEVSEDEEPKRVNFEKIAKLREAFTPADKGGTVTAANASSLNDGGAACIISSASWAAKNQAVKPMARIIAFADGSLDPMEFAIAPASAVEKILKHTAINKQDIDLWEINEAFAAVVLANVQLLDIDMNKVNIHGGAVSCGHPVGMSGCRIVGHLAYNLKPGQKGMAAICNAGGGASAMLIEAL